MTYLFKGGVLDGHEYGEESGLRAVQQTIKVGVKDGKPYSYPNGVVMDFQTYIRNGNVFELLK
jgi:hypothetical protein